MMDRRAFLGTALAGPAWIAGAASPAGTAQPDGSGDNEAPGALAGYSLDALLAEYRADLFDDYLPFVDKFVVDHEYGGFMCTTDRDGVNVSTNKSNWYQGRGIWVYSFLYNNLAKEQQYLDVAAQTVDFMMRHRLPSGQWPSAFARDGAPLDEPKADIYGDIFLANGLSEFAVASGDKVHRAMAKDLLLQSVEFYDRPDYPYQVNYGPDVEPFTGQRVLGHWMVLLRLATQMLAHEPDPQIEAVADRCVDVILNHHFNREYTLLNEVLTHDMHLPDNAYAQFAYTGHAIETLWMLLYEALRSSDEGLFDRAAELFKRHVKVAWDDVYGGVFRALLNVDANEWALDKVLWAQEEVLIGCLCLIEHRNDPWARDWFGRMYTYVKEKYPLKPYGHALWILGADRKVTYEPRATRVGNFHHPRHLMLNILSVERMLAKNDTHGHNNRS